LWCSVGRCGNVSEIRAFLGKGSGDAVVWLVGVLYQGYLSPGGMGVMNHARTPGRVPVEA